ncbi:dephospho-CoA kinase [Bdellovibrio sp. HCB2-146]|uniref:dephospho-CoA kinase n=1 Tax=Bdellovibrio sp. HCB2-146 TaxID=3394362 RepID=UPI0039BCD5D5
MKWIGLTGGIACGKSTVAQLLVQQSYPLVDADRIARDVVAPGTPGLESVIQAFGPDILAPDGSLDREKLGAKIFSLPEQRRKLESILHPLIRTEVQRLREDLERAGHVLAFYDIPLLFETKAQSQFDEIVVVTCKPEQQRERLRKRNGLSGEEIEKRLASQMPMSLKEEQANFVLHNDGDQAHLMKEFQRLVDWLKTLSV